MNTQKALRNLLWLPTVALVSLASCTEGFDDDVTYASKVRNQQLEAPVLSWQASADGSKTEVSWPVVHGAGGYQFSLYNVTDAENPITIFEDTIIDGVKLTIPRVEDQFYKLTATTLGNTKYNNKGSQAKDNTIFTGVNALNDTPIADGSDLSTVIKNLLEAKAPEAGAEFGIDITPGATVTMSEKVDLGNYRVTVRSTNALKPATVVMGENGGFETETACKLQNLVFDCEGMTNKNSSVLAMKAEPSFEQTTDHWLLDQGNPIVLQNCRFKHLITRALFDNCKKWAIYTILIKGCTFDVWQTDQAKKKSDLGGTSAVYVIDLSNAFCYDLTITESTFSCPADQTLAATNPGLVQFEGQRSQQICDGKYGDNIIKITNNTFVNITKSTKDSNGMMFSWARFRGQKNTRILNQKNIYVDCGGQRVKRNSILQGQQGGMGCLEGDFKDNVYMYDGELGEGWNTFPNPDEIAVDPQLTQDPETGIFKVGAAEVIAAGCGDPRGLQ